MGPTLKTWMAKPWHWALAFAALDVVWLGFLHFPPRHVAPENLLGGDPWNDFYVMMARSWNDLHAPIRAMAEPLLLPVVTNHPLTPGPGMFYLYMAVCVSQSVVVGLALGAVVAGVLRLVRGK